MSGESGSLGRVYLLLHALLMFLSLADVASKYAAGFSFLSIGFVMCYGIVLGILFVYALGWQQVIKRMPLTTAYANRGATVVWGIVWGALLFSEAITFPKLLGAVMIIGGIVLFSFADAEDAKEGLQEGDAP